jgi:DNA uptake protein ComE-like DNA-binding protein
MAESEEVSVGLGRFLFAGQRFFQEIAMRGWGGVRCGVVAAAVWVGLGAGGAGMAAQSAGPGAAAQAATQPKQQTVAEKIAASKGLLDINTATPAQLKALPGMGDAYVQRVIAGRPYTAKNQLTTRGILPASEYEAIKEQIIAHRVKP